MITESCLWLSSCWTFPFSVPGEAQEGAWEHSIDGRLVSFSLTQMLSGFISFHQHHYPGLQQELSVAKLPLLAFPNHWNQEGTVVTEGWLLTRVLTAPNTSLRFSPVNISWMHASCAWGHLRPPTIPELSGTISNSRCPRALLAQLLHLGSHGMHSSCELIQSP